MRAHLLKTLISGVYALILIIPALFSLPSLCNAQNLLSTPESIIFDSAHNRYLISNYPAGDIVQVDSIGNQSFFVQSQGTNFQGLEIVGNVIYVGANQYVRGYDLQTRQMVMNIHVPNVTNLNDITADTLGNLYVSDVFSTKIIKVRISTQTYSVFVDGQGINRPNGVFYDRPHNRILVCSFRANSPIQAINLADSTVSTIVNTNLSNCDGITKDMFGNYYVTSWNTVGIYRFDSSFTMPPVLIYQNSCGPADISFDQTHNAIAIPLQSCNSWTLLPVIGIKKMGEVIPKSFDLFQNFPNPFNPVTKIRFSIPSGKAGVKREMSNVKLAVFNILGQEATVLVNEVLKPGTYEVSFDGAKFPSGVYFYRLQTEGFSDTKKMVLVK